MFRKVPSSLPQISVPAHTHIPAPYSASSCIYFVYYSIFSHLCQVPQLFVVISLSFLYFYKFLNYHFALYYIHHFRLQRNFPQNRCFFQGTSPPTPYSPEKDNLQNTRIFHSFSCESAYGELSPPQFPCCNIELQRFSQVIHQNQKMQQNQ